MFFPANCGEAAWSKTRQKTVRRCDWNTMTHMNFLHHHGFGRTTSRQLPGVVFGLAFVAMIGGCMASASASDHYSFATWKNGWRKNQDDSSPDVFQIQTDRFEFALDVEQMSQPRLGPSTPMPGYQAALETECTDWAAIPAASLTLQMVVDGRSYTAKRCAAGTRGDLKRLADVRLWESGRFVQHFDFLGLEILDASGRRLDVESRLDIVAWPDRLVFTLIAEGLPSEKTVDMSLHLRSAMGEWSAAESFEVKAEEDGEQRVRMVCHFDKEHASTAEVDIAVMAHDGQQQVARPDDDYACHAVKFGRLRRPFQTGYQPNRGFDEFEISVTPRSKTDSIAAVDDTVPFMLHLSSPANITGIAPVLCDSRGRPTGIPVQLSKNWHYEPKGSYAIVFAMLPRQTATYRLRLAYGFYGALPSASHAQLSLVGYGGHGRWDQFAIGCWGETICFDSDRSLVDCAITDIRMLMARDGIDGRKWSWTEAGWGGDWLDIRNVTGQKFHPRGVKTAYLSHGPCMPRMLQTGFYGTDQQVSFSADVQVARADDYARTFQTLRYQFHQEVSADDVSFFSLGRTHHYATPFVDVGQRSGLIRQIPVDAGRAKGDRIIDSFQWNGEAPHWVALTGAYSVAAKTKPNGYRALIVHRYRANLGGKVYQRPTLDVRVHQSDPANVDLRLVPPAPVSGFRSGDQVELMVELITLPRNAEDYYGPNEVFREHLHVHPSSWETTLREATNHEVATDVSGGQLLQAYPVVIRASDSTVRWRHQDGVGPIPVRIEGLSTIKDFSLHQIVDGSKVPFELSSQGVDQWQVDRDPTTGTFALTFNLPSDEPSRQWVFETTAGDH
ncbi:hypothetical protein Pan14r_36850 [Crateriforma conspicua]|uniref:Uncharacterized protein n=2 Tax=Crateriforma conspicua TaxID=2527996 RepID=A0A5C5YAN2_9PLAN|nr:hypothetical protein Pan14r_36850 [Crateriforma conspicua]